MKGRNYLLEINEEICLEIAAEYGVRRIDILQDFGPVINRVDCSYIEGDSIAYGLAQFPDRVTLFLAHDWMGWARMDIVKTNILHTLLHEIRHLIQFAKQMPFPTDMDRENDANEWAKKNRHKYARLIRIKFSHSPSLSKLSAAEKRARA